MGKIIIDDLPLLAQIMVVLFILAVIFGIGKMVLNEFYEYMDSEQVKEIINDSKETLESAENNFNDALELRADLEKIPKKSLGA